MRIAVVASSFPQPDLASGDLRFATLLSLMARANEVVYCALDARGNAKAPTAAAARLTEQGIALCTASLADLLKHFSADIVWFEFFYQARADYVGVVRRYCPRAKVVVDSVDVHFNRLAARADLTGLAEDIDLADTTKARELAAYVRADLVIAVSANDRDLLLREAPDVPVHVVPNVHEVPDYPDPDARRHGELVFVGGFRHDPNVDAVLYFCHEILPLILRSHPLVRTRIVGSNPPPEVLALAGPNVEILGYVPETAPYLRSAYISIAPLRYGGGLKGKVGEAMSYGLPVVTTSVGAQGFGLTPDHDLLVGDTASEFAARVTALLDDAAMHRRIGRNGYEFISRHYSVPSVARMLDECLKRALLLPARSTASVQASRGLVRTLYQRHIAWRLRRT